MFVDVLMDFSWICLLLAAGFFLRKNVAVFQKLFIPVSLIGGLLGLLCGPQVLGKFCPVYIHWSENIGSYAMPLLAILFSVQFFGLKFDKKVFRNSSAVFFIASITMFVQVFFAMILTRAFGLPDGFSLLPQTGFFGGHGIPGVVSAIFEQMGYWDANEAFSIGTTFATIGLLTGVIGGIFLVNVASRKGYLVNKEGTGELSEEEKTGYIPPEKRKNIMIAITHNASLDPLAFHVAIVGTIMLLGYGLLALCKLVPLFANFTITVPVMVVGILAGIIANKTKVKNVIDRGSLQRIGCTALEILIVSSVANTDLSVVFTYGMQIIVISVVLLVLTTFIVFFFSKKWITESWFEHGITMFGAFTGVMATGMMLLRIADPNMETPTTVNVAAANPVWMITTQNVYLAFAPMWVVTAAGFDKTMIGTGIALVVFLVLGFLLFRNRAKA